MLCCILEWMFPTCRNTFNNDSIYSISIRWEIPDYRNHCSQMIRQTCFIQLKRCFCNIIMHYEYVGLSFSSFVGLICSPWLISVLWYIIMQIGFMIVFVNENKKCLSWAAQVLSKRPTSYGYIYLYVIIWPQAFATNILKSTKLSSILGSFDDFISWKVTCTTFS